MKPETGSKTGWSTRTAIRKGQIIGEAVSGVVTVVIIVLCRLMQPKALGIFAWLYFAILQPAGFFLAELFGTNASWFDNDEGNLAFLPICLIVGTNTIVGYLLGTLVGALVKLIGSKNREREG